MEGIFLHDAGRVCGRRPARALRVAGRQRSSWSRTARARGQTILDRLSNGRGIGENAWVGRPEVDVGVGVDSGQVVAFVVELLKRSSPF